jgi:hypothetical protein
MNRMVLYLVWGLLLFFAVDTSAQSLLNRLEFGISGQALSDYVDLNPDKNSPSITSLLEFTPAAIIRYNSPYRFALRGSYFAKNTFEPMREYEINLKEDFVSLETFESIKSYEVDLNEDFISVMGEFHFNDFNFYQKDSRFVPYLGFGLAYIIRKADVLPVNLVESLVEEFSSNEISDNDGDYRDALNSVLSKNRKSIIAAFGAKIKQNRITISGELSGGVLLPVKKDDALEIRQRGKSLLNDWYVFPNFTITYTFGPNF